MAKDIKAIMKAINGSRQLFGDEETFLIVAEVMEDLGKQVEVLDKENSFLTLMLETKIENSKLQKVEVSDEEYEQMMCDLFGCDEVLPENCDGCICQTCEGTEEDCESCKLGDQRCNGCTLLDTDEEE